MVLDVLHNQIRAAYQGGATVEEIAVQFNCAPAAVKMALADSEEFTDQDCREVAAVIKQIALYGDNERNRLTAATYIYDVKKGHKVSKRDAPTVTAVQINQLIHAAQQDINRFLGSPRCDTEGQKHIEVESDQSPTSSREPTAPAPGPAAESDNSAPAQTPGAPNPS